MSPRGTKVQAPRSTSWNPARASKAPSVCTPDRLVDDLAQRMRPASIAHFFLRPSGFARPDSRSLIGCRACDRRHAGTLVRAESDCRHRHGTCTMPGRNGAREIGARSDGGTNNGESRQRRPHNGHPGCSPCDSDAGRLRIEQVRGLAELAVGARVEAHQARAASPEVAARDREAAGLERAVRARPVPVAMGLAVLAARDPVARAARLTLPPTRTRSHRAAKSPARPPATNAAIATR